MADQAEKARQAAKVRAERKALRLVANGLVEWSADIGPSGGFTGVGGMTLNELPSVLIALWDHRIRGLIAVNGEEVALTNAGGARLSEWDGGGARG